MLMLVPDGGVPSGGGPAPWNERLPEPLLALAPPKQINVNWAYESITENLKEAGLRLHSWWDIDVAYLIPTPLDLYLSLTWPFQEDEVPAFREVEPGLERLFAEFAGPQGLGSRWRRSIWKAVVGE
jgi:hypothetical protein